MSSSGSWDKYIVPIITTVIGGVVLVYVLNFMGLGAPPDSKPNDNEKSFAKKAGAKQDEPVAKKVPAKQDEPVAKVPVATKPEKAAVAPDLKPSDLLGEWEAQTPIPGLTKSRLIFTKSGRVFWKRDERMDRVNFTIKGDSLTLEGTTSNNKPLIYNAERKGDLLNLNLQGVVIAPSGLTRLGGKWKRLGDYDTATYDRKPLPMDVRLPGRWQMDGKSGTGLLEILPTGVFHLRNTGSPMPMLSGELEFTGKGTVDVIVNQREILPMKLEFTSVRNFELATLDKGIGEEKQLRGKWFKVQ